MSTIRRQSIISSIVIYIGFAIGLLNIYLFTKKGIFLDSQYGLYNAFIAIATLMMAFASMGMPTYFYKFFPYYKAHTEPKKNDQATIALTMGIVGFIFIIIAGVIFKNIVVKKYDTNAPELVTYYEWIFPLGFGLLIFTLLEAYAWQIHRSVFTNFLKEVGWRLFTTIIIVLFLFGIIDFSLFIKLFSFSYPFIAIILLAYLVYTRQINFTFNRSKVTQRFSKSILKLCGYVYAGLVIFNISIVFDSLVISSVLDDALTQLAIYSVAQNIASMIQAPQRGIIAASIAHLSQAWKDKNLGLIQRIYQRSSINQLLFAAGFLSLIILSFLDAVHTFNLKDTYIKAFYVIILLGLTKMVDMGTGVNSQIIATSIYWRFEMISGIVLLSVMLPLSYFLTKEFGIVGTGVAQLISISIYNIIRIVFLYRKFKLFPFSMQSLYTVLLAGACFAVCYFSFQNIHSWAGMFVRSIAFIILYGAGAIYLNLSPDIKPVLETIRKRLGLQKS